VIGNFCYSNVANTFIVTGQIIRNHLLQISEYKKVIGNIMLNSLTHFWNLRFTVFIDRCVYQTMEVQIYRYASLNDGDTFKEMCL